ncbi:MAG: sugar phosphate isomerase/epimerase [candidate division KSB1 bacterium]|nr:sugar phosphate isomerase/epimerase [candidate division KSB1 bacterium]
MSKKMRFGLVTYQWGRDWDLPTLLKSCAATGYEGVELRTRHAHGVEPSLTREQRSAVKRLFRESGIVCVGYGSNQEYHSPDPQELRRQIEGTFELIKLCHDIGASGVKVKPNDLPDGVPAEKTIAQIAASLNEIGRFAHDYGQEIRVEVHGRLTQLPQTMKAIFDQVTENNVRICWNCNPEDLVEPGFEYNFNLLRPWFGSTLHVRELDDADYPYRQLFDLLKATDYCGWVLLEARSEPQDRLEAMRLQKQLFMRLMGMGK